MPGLITSIYLKLLFMFRKLKVGGGGFLLRGAVCFGQPRTQITPTGLVPQTCPAPRARGCSKLIPPKPFTGTPRDPGVSGTEQSCLPPGRRRTTFPWREGWRLKLLDGVTSCQHLRSTLCFCIVPIFGIQLLPVNCRVTMSRIR